MMKNAAMNVMAYQAKFKIITSASIVASVIIVNPLIG